MSSFKALIAIMTLLCGGYGLHAQCGQVQSVLMACNGGPGPACAFQGRTVNAVRAGNNQVRSNYTITLCSNGCYVGYQGASGACLSASLESPEILKQLNRVSKQAKVLVASCTGGLVLYRPGEPHSFKFEMPLELNLPRLENKHHGE